MNILDNIELDDDVFNELGEEVTVIEIKSQKIEELLLKYAYLFDEIDEDDTDLRIGKNDGKIVIYSSIGELYDSDINSFVSNVFSDYGFLSNSGLEDYDFEDMYAEFDEKSDVLTDSIESIKWYGRIWYDKHNLDAFIDQHFNEAKGYYEDGLSDEEIQEDILRYHWNVAYISTYVFDRKTGFDGKQKSSIECL